MLTVWFDKLTTLSNVEVLSKVEGVAKNYFLRGYIFLSFIFDITKNLRVSSFLRGGESLF